MIDRSLYYPYIHLRDVEWLKATLLLFSRVRRMTPLPGPQPDDGPVAPFTQDYGGREPLLTSTNLWSKRAQAAQVQLARRLEEDAQDPDFQQRFGRRATETARDAGDRGFQIHQGKLDDRLKQVLRDTRLAWQPGNPEPYDWWLDYVELNPRVGEAVMATLAIACAKGEGLDIVADERSGPLHECLTKKLPKDVYDTWLKPTDDIADPPGASGPELFEFVIHIACDTTQLDLQALAGLGRANRANMDNYWKQFSASGCWNLARSFWRKPSARRRRRRPPPPPPPQVGGSRHVCPYARL